jgi:hypothetical protein
MFGGLFHELYTCSQPFELSRNGPSSVDRIRIPDDSACLLCSEQRHCEHALILSFRSPNLVSLVPSVSDAKHELCLLQHVGCSMHLVRL